LEPVKDEGVQLTGREVEARQPSLGLGVEVLGQLPEAMGTSQKVPPGGAGYPIEMRRRRCLWQFDQGVEGHQRTTEQGEQQLPHPVGEGRDPLADSGADWALPDQAFHQAVDTQSSQEVERDDALQERDHVMPIGMQEVGEQAVGAPTGLAADALHADAINLQTCERLSLVRAPPDQDVGGSTVGMRTAVGKSKKAARKRVGLGVVLGRMGVVLYNDHVGAPPLVVIFARIGPFREAFSFLASLFSGPIVLLFAILVNLTGISCGPSTASWRFNHCDRSSSCSAGCPFNLSAFDPILSKERGL
jgi:hypothetical protein